MKEAIVIGAGLGGLAAGIKLAANGVKVKIFDENSHAGGKMMKVEEAGYTFDFGPNTMTMPHVFNRVLSSAGFAPEKYFEFEKLTDHTKNYFHDGSVLWQSANAEVMTKQLEKVDPFAADHYHSYLNEVKRLYHLAEDQFFYRNFTSWKDYLSPGLAKALVKVRPFEQMDHFHRRFFSHPHVLQTFNRYATYIGSSPYKCPATFALIGHLEMNEGVYYVKGGNTKIAAGFARAFKELGGELHLNQRVKKIIVKDKKAVGVELLSGEKAAADFIVVNGDFITATRQLIVEEDRPAYPNKKLDNYEPSISAYVIMAGLKERNPNLVHHQVYFTENYQEEFEQLFKKKQMPKDPTIYISHSASTDPDVTKGSNAFILVNAPARPMSQEEAKAYKEVVYKKLANFGLDLSSKIVAEKIVTPTDITSRFSAYKGALYGISSHSMRNSFLRPMNAHPDIQNIHYVGGTTHPGGGSPMVTISGMMTPIPR
ncbi:phytoene desaturase [Bacillus ectoiniformans]|uniref:phytoene desaturase family protein n=1 Tax=Bacillus ectoiniformans TaxID=1494429 RepID=UPI00195B8F5A|nr:phytoene desaturase family protein [Bacillus ectoiniformans]MBM7647880.1 phytoene desaturase [Bacillus ectoiniformans]